MDRRADRQRRPRASRIIVGEPIHVGEREIVPVVRVTTHSQRRAHIGSGRVAGQGWAQVSMRPVAIIERSQGSERQIRIPDRTAQLIGGLCLAAFIIPLLLALAVRLMRK
jgi:uncharacterized spore protein YtfJ